MKKSAFDLTTEFADRSVYRPEWKRMWDWAVWRPIVPVGTPSGLEDAVSRIVR